MKTKKTKQMRLLFVVNGWTGRGAEVQLQRFVRSWPSWMHADIFVLNSAGVESVSDWHDERIEFHLCPASTKLNVLRAVTLLKFLSKMKYDVIVTVGLGAALFLGRICAVLTGVRVIYSTLHTVRNLHTFSTRYFDPFNRMLNIILPKWPGLRILRFLPNSKKLAEVVNSEVNGYLSQILYNGLSIDELRDVYQGKVCTAGKKLLRPLSRRAFIVQVGTLDTLKNHTFILQCLEMLKNDFPNLKLVIIGDGPLHKQLAEWVEVNDLAKNVIFAGSMKPDEILQIVHKARVLTLTSFTESFPNVLLEAQALSVPVVCFDVGGCSEIVNHGASGYVVRKGDRHAFCEYLAKLLTNRNHARKMGMQGKERVLTNFTMSRKTNNFLSLLEKDLCKVMKQSHGA